MLHLAAASGQLEVVNQLLAAARSSADFTDALDMNKWNALHYAAERSHVGVVSRLLAERPSLANVEDSYGRTALFYAEAAQVVELLLAVTPEAVRRFDHVGNTLLHMVVERTPTLTEKVWRMNLEALHVVNGCTLTPFDLVVRSNNWAAVELFQPKLTLDCIFATFAEHCDRASNEQARERLQLVVKGQCEEVLVPCLHLDLLDTVYEYIGFFGSAHARRRKRGNVEHCPF